LSPTLVKIQAQTIYETLASLKPEAADKYKANLDKLLDDLDELSSSIEKTLAPLEQRDLLVFHPAWGYFCDEFGLTQFAIEFEGKTPSPRKLKEIIEFTEEKDIPVIFVQKQFSTASAEAIAESTGASVVQMDPLAENYIENLQLLAETILTSTTTDE
jgi:zinc transport system substrate-binding protein